MRDNNGIQTHRTSTVEMNEAVNPQLLDSYDLKLKENMISWSRILISQLEFWK